MNVGLMATRRPQVAAVPARPRSPEGRGMLHARPRSPNTGGSAGAPMESRRSSGFAGGNTSLNTSGVQPPARRATNTVEEIKRIDVNREQRRRAADDIRRTRTEEAAILGAQCGGSAPDIDFHRMIRDFRQQCPSAQVFGPLDFDDPGGIAVCVRKRPIQQHEVAIREMDCITTCNPLAIVHERKLKVDGITKCLESHQFQFDRVFGEESSTDDVYRSVAQPLVPWVIGNGGRATLFAYGQTGSGKTHTMTGIQRLLAQEVFVCIARHPEPFEIAISFFEIYGGRPYDLLNNRQRLETLEDSRNEVQISGLTEHLVTNAEGMLQIIELGSSLRTTHATAINRDSSRSHAICAVCVRLPGAGAAHAKITLVDLAGSERAADSKSTIRQRRVEGAQINKSLLALKECIRAMGQPREAHIPFRASKLTLVLRDAFASKSPSRTVMIACISPGISSADHSVNTLRYSDRLKDHPRAARHSMSVDESLLEGGQVARRAAAPVVPARDARSLETRNFLRRRSPSPISGETSPGMQPAPSTSSQRVPIGSGGLPMISGVARGEAQATQYLPSDSEEEEVSGVVEDELLGSQPKSAWDAEVQVHATASGRGRAVGSNAAAGRRGGQQPMMSSTACGRPLNRAEVLGNRSVQQTRPTAVGVAARGATATASNGSMVARRHEAPGTPDTHSASGEAGFPAGGRDRFDTDLRQQDDRYLHATLTTEVFERGATAEGGDAIVDVGVQDLDDLAHMEALDVVRQWEDKIVQQHMVALQEDAKLLTAESELLSKVQQGASDDIDWYVGELEMCVSRKLQVYGGLLRDLEAFKSHLRREELLSRSCQRNRGGRSYIDETDNLFDGDGSIGHQAVPADSSQRTPHTPR